MQHRVEPHAPCIDQRVGDGRRNREDEEGFFFFFLRGAGEVGGASRFERGVEAGMSELSELEENTDEKLRRMPS